MLNPLTSRPVELAKGPIVRSIFTLPRRVLEKMAGTPVVIDGKTLDAEMQLILKLQKADGPEVASLPIAAGRRSVVSGSQLVGGSPPVGAVSDRTIPGPAGDLRLRLYTPTGLSGVAPALLFIHGGGSIYGDLESHDATCRFFAERAGVRVVAVDYRLAPEHPFPAAYDDVWATYEWLLAHAEGVGIDADKLAVGGDSAGGNLAAAIAQTAVREGVTAPAFQLLIYPATDFVDTRPSRHAFGAAFFLTNEFIDLAKKSYTLSNPDPADPRLSPLRGTLAGLPPVYLVTAGFDPLLDEGKEYADKLREAGVEVEYRCEEGLIHSFANMVSLGSSAPAALARAAEALRRALSR